MVLLFVWSCYGVLAPHATKDSLSSCKRMLQILQGSFPRQLVTQISIAGKSFAPCVRTWFCSNFGCIGFDLIIWYPIIRYPWIWVWRALFFHQDFRPQHVSAGLEDHVFSMALFDCRAYRDEALTKANAEIQLLKRVSVASSCLANLVATRNNRIGLALVQANLGTRGPKAAEAATRGIYMRIGKEVFEQYMNRLNDPAVFKTSTGCYACSDADHSSPRNKGKGRGRAPTASINLEDWLAKWKFLDPAWTMQSIQVPHANISYDI